MAITAWVRVFDTSTKVPMCVSSKTDVLAAGITAKTWVVQAVGNEMVCVTELSDIEVPDAHCRIRLPSVTYPLAVYEAAPIPHGWPVEVRSPDAYKPHPSTGEAGPLTALAPDPVVARVKASVPEVVIGEPATDSGVPLVVAATLDTVPAPGLGRVVQSPVPPSQYLLAAGVPPHPVLACVSLLVMSSVQPETIVPRLVMAK